MINKFTVFAFIFSISMISCSSQEKKEVNPKEEKIAVKEIVETKPVENKVYESIPLEWFKQVFNESNNLDITLYEGDKSVSLADDNVKYILSMISVNSISKENKSPIGHMMILKDGNTFSFEGNELSLIEIYMEENNNYVVFKIGDKNYYDVMSEKGIIFFNKLIGNTK